MGRERPQKASRHISKYLARNESVALEMKQHWARIVPAALCCLTGLVLVLVAGLLAPASLGFLTNAAWWIWLVLVGHLLWRIVEWRDEIFVITNRRLILVHGLFVKKVAMMPLSKVTDMSYNRSLPGRLLGYGTYVMESAGQDQALSTIPFVRDPDAIYRDLCALIFGEEPPPESEAGDEDDGWDGEAWNDDASARWEPDPDAPYDHTARPWDDEPAGHRQPRVRRGRGSRDIDDTDPFGVDVHESVTTSGRSTPPTGHDDYTSGTADDLWLDEEDDQSAWSVSREHATQPQQVRRSRHPD